MTITVLPMTITINKTAMHTMAFILQRLLRGEFYRSIVNFSDSLLFAQSPGGVISQGNKTSRSHIEMICYSRSLLCTIAAAIVLFSSANAQLIDPTAFSGLQWRML